MTETELHAWIDRAKTRPQDGDGSGLNLPDTWVSPVHRYFCMAIPKAACSKIKLVLQQLEGLPLPPYCVNSLCQCNGQGFQMSFL